MKESLLGLSLVELKELFVSLGEKPFRALQVWKWIYVKGAQSFAQMSNLSLALRETLEEKYSIERAMVEKELISFDETRKWLLKLSDKNEVETVYIPESTRGTLCISSQVGCTLTCKFCHTGTQTLVRNLTAGEIVAQFLHAKDALEDWSGDNQGRALTNIVMMGMGEPLFNYENVAKALKIIMDPEGLNLSKRKITLSTSGVVPMIEQCGEELAVNLAISLHAVTDELRSHLVPLNKKYPLAELLAACRNYPALTHERRITFEYVMLKDVNDSVSDAKALLNLIKGLPAKVNLIPFNPWPGSEFECSSPEQIAKFAQVLENAGYKSPVRTPRGQDIFAACGQLKSDSERKRKTAPVAAEQQATA
jgi:23S rRNA (adenine2503-C2)-methyltransferase